MLTINFMTNLNVLDAVTVCILVALVAHAVPISVLLP